MTLRKRVYIEENDPVFLRQELNRLIKDFNGIYGNDKRKILSAKKIMHILDKNKFLYDQIPRDLAKIVRALSNAKAGESVSDIYKKIF
jgi:hypothetical protein